MIAFAPGPSACVTYQIALSHVGILLVEILHKRCASEAFALYDRLAQAQGTERPKHFIKCIVIDL